LLDAAALLGASPRDQERLRGRPDPDASGRARRPRDGAPDRLVLGRARRGDPVAVRLADGRGALSGGGIAARGDVPATGVEAAARDDSRACRLAVPLLPALPGAAVRGAGPRPADRMTEPELHRKNMILGLALFGVFLLFFGLTIAAAFIYLAVD